MKNTKEGVGVVVGRFQVNDLTDGHKALFDSVYEKHEQVIIFLGLAPTKVTRNNPLDFMTRKLIIEGHYPNATILYIKDDPSNEEWSIDLDNQIENNIKPNEKVMLYGSRDSFIKHYTGNYPTEVLLQEIFESGTIRRNRIGTFANKKLPGFAEGMISAVMNQYTTIFSTVDIAIYDKENSRLLLGRKRKEKKHRFIGGFVNPNETAESAAIRETKEETGLTISKLKFIGTTVIDDWRYRGEKENILTTFFVAEYEGGEIIPMDDIEELKWFDLPKKGWTDKGLQCEVKGGVETVHSPLINMFLNYITKELK